MLVGKGITFDSGGLSIKPAESMTTMKRDMTGGGVVISVLGALAAVDCPVKVTGLVAAAENSVGGDSMRPGDVLRHYGGRTSEVTNTDAEGRLVMADALAYAVDKLAPAAMVDVATLTGSMKVALGQQVAGYFANHEALASAIFEAGEASGEPFWRFPLVSDYEDKLTSKVADADNAAGGAGSITAALFLQHFVGSVPWAHLDIASVGDSPERELRVERRPDRLRRPRAARVAGPARPPGRNCRKVMMHALTVRWSLTEAPDGVEDKLAAYVEETSHARFTGMDGLRFKTWRMRPGEWFEGCYVFASDEARAAFQADLRARPPPSRRARRSSAPRRS